ncbi:uncharacterized protein YutE (UPF0331/DUF86 family) [Amycolatopsis umgeniensis]|uniref:Uncharacterized protein YutE (UPF0331/DUF86 family) n=1 Tax=Amycolatopsis umgeniensis TaxID=336628 RepID=A0A841B6P3_9PSEU|nr:uncharacterized protein YutE (UPF0331/DUF86 family) [Amycolatopsis umgeniensis]
MELWQDAESRLTPAARETLDELIEDIRRQIILTADRTAYSSEISVRDVVEAAQRSDVARPSASGPGSHRRRRLIFLVAIIYATIGAATAFYGVLSKNFLDLPGNTSSLITISGASLMTASTLLVAISYLQLRKARREESIRGRTEYGINEFLSEFVQVESKLRLSTANLLGESTSERPINQIARDLAKAGFLTEADVAELQDLSAIRNKIVHGATQPGDAALHQSVRRLTRLLSVVGRLADK